MISSFKTLSLMGREMSYSSAFLHLSRNRVGSIAKICLTKTDETEANNIPNTSFQSTLLPSLTVPPLSRTIVNFLLFSKSVQTKNDDFMETLEVSRKFVQNEEVHKLQALLEERAKKLPNWMTPWWINYAYLESRTPLPITTSPGMSLPKLNFTGVNSQCKYAAKIIHAALTYHHIIIDQELTPERIGTEPLDMNQYELMFGTTRVPKRKRDVIRYGRDSSSWPKQIIVTRNGHSFEVPVYDTNGEILSIDQLQSQLLEVVAQSTSRNEFSINIVSSDNRDVWADVYERLRQSSPNSVQSVENALFVLSLDSSIKDSIYLPAEESMRQGMHGGGTNQNTCNRWFDKALQFCINDEGLAGFTYEHTPAEGPPFAALMDFVQDKLSDDNFDSKSAIGSTIEKPKKLEFIITDEDKQTIQSSSERINKAIDDLEIKCLSFEHFGKNVPKAARMSPDSFIQMAMQLAFYNIHGTHAPTYETASLRRFAQGRTETIRLPNNASISFVEGASLNNSDNLKSLLTEAINAHKDYTKTAMLGNGMDRHLLGLKLMALETKNTKLPELYASKAYNKLMHFRLSTSQVPTHNVLPMGYGPSADDCYGVCYNPRENTINFTITAFNNCSETSAQRFAKELEAVLLQMKEIVSNS